MPSLAAFTKRQRHALEHVSRYKPFDPLLNPLADSTLISGVKAPAFAESCWADERAILVYESQVNDSGDIHGRFIQDQ